MVMNSTVVMMILFFLLLNQSNKKFITCDGEAQFICRPLEVDKEDGSVLRAAATSTNVKLRSSISLPTVVIDPGKELSTDASVSAGTLPPKEIVAVVRPSNFTRSSASNNLDQKCILRDDYEMCLDIKFKTEAAKRPKMDHLSCWMSVFV
ncbi:structural maintenance of chromosomes flexible hinge domain-containing protein GMI1-like isoform X2 [Beta vulgaris subsp. vulgaris]|uniref:structural maintenance of chromosomes flexible hinge domain-containing protein GMI1-like isoform X2 n=1 Tax=Beta vulgaris subsp. vulgaris TaxID=3555 RepID=UPI0020368990|nr:structural maintenance of chromosomes flexible hinge domain-containing protein GMI1-like isoform X2 [Beta vulgaris subsp. vulgaris]XP_048490383.1 structural maintenance of chromosomes flexible hinge domain-containing protein GMI1-like isoform X2 [Beta vulgaris subsp. vulgaris]